VDWVCRVRRGRGQHTEVTEGFYKEKRWCFLRSTWQGDRCLPRGREMEKATKEVVAFPGMT
jgi:hypothetical protein